MLALRARESAWSRGLCKEACVTARLPRPSAPTFGRTAVWWMLSLYSMSINQSWSGIWWFHSLGFCWLLTLNFPNLWLLVFPWQSLPGCLKEEFHCTVKRKWLPVLSYVKTLSFLQAWPIVTQAMRWGLILLSLSFLPAKSTPPLTSFCVSQWVLLPNRFKEECERFYLLNFYLSEVILQENFSNP